MVDKMGLFSFFKKTFGKIEEKSETERKVSTVSDVGNVSKQETFDIVSVENFLEKKFDESFQSFIENVKKSYEEIQVRLNEFEQSLIDLEKARFEENINHETLHLNITQINLADAHRKSFINKMGIMINQLNKPLDSNLDSIVEYQQRSLLLVIKANIRSVRDYSLFEGFLPKESKEAIKNFKILINTVKKFDNSVHKHISNISLIKKAQNEFPKLKEKIESIRKNEKPLKTLNKRLRELKLKSRSIEERLKKLELDENFKHWMEKKNILNSKLLELKSEISQYFSQINRPLKKFLYLVKKGKEKIEEEKMLNNYLDSPADTLIVTNDSNSINSILNKIQKSILNGRLKVKNKDKVLAAIKHIIDKNVFQKLIIEYTSTVNDSEKLEKEIQMRDVLKLKNKLEKNLTQTRKEIDSTAKEIENTEKQIKQLSSSIEGNKNNLAEMLSTISESKSVTIEVLQCDWCRKIIDEPSYTDIFGNTKYGFCSKECKKEFEALYNKMQSLGQSCGPSCACH